MSLDPLETDFLGDLWEATHGIWEIFEFIRLHWGELDDLEVYHRGMHYIRRWQEASWIQVAKAPLHPTTVTTLDQTIQMLEAHGVLATRYFPNAPSIDITLDGRVEYRNAEQADPVNRHPSGTSVMSPADPATRAGATPEASGDF